MPRCTHSGPAHRMSVGDGRSLAPGASLVIDFDAIPEWSAAHKWRRRGWLVVEGDKPSVTSSTDDALDTVRAVADIQSMRVAELRDWIAAHGGTAPRGARKSELQRLAVECLDG